MSSGRVAARSEARATRETAVECALVVSDVWDAAEGPRLLFLMRRCLPCVLQLVGAPQPLWHVTIQARHVSYICGDYLWYACSGWLAFVN